MPSRVCTLAVDAVDAELLAAFWCQVLGHEVLERDEGILSIAGEHGPAIDLVEVPEDKTLENRLHPDLRADGTSTADEPARLKGLGARQVDVGQERPIAAEGGTGGIDERPVTGPVSVRGPGPEGVAAAARPGTTPATPRTTAATTRPSTPTRGRTSTPGRTSRAAPWRPGRPART